MLFLMLLYVLNRNKKLLLYVKYSNEKLLCLLLLLFTIIHSLYMIYFIELFNK